MCLPVCVCGCVSLSCVCECVSIYVRCMGRAEGGSVTACAAVLSHVCVCKLHVDRMCCCTLRFGRHRRRQHPRMHTLAWHGCACGGWRRRGHGRSRCFLLLCLGDLHLPHFRCIYTYTSLTLVYICTHTYVRDNTYLKNKRYKYIHKIKDNVRHCAGLTVSALCICAGLTVSLSASSSPLRVLSPAVAARARVCGVCASVYLGCMCGDI
jgi:hypothetical protein